MSPAAGRVALLGMVPRTEALAWIAAADPGIRVVHRADARSLADALCRVVW
jgi:hypothetical protein